MFNFVKSVLINYLSYALLFNQLYAQVFILRNSGTIHTLFSAENST